MSSRVAWFICPMDPSTSLSPDATACSSSRGRGPHPWAGCAKGGVQKKKKDLKKKGEGHDARRRKAWG